MLPAALSSLLDHVQEHLQEASLGAVAEHRLARLLLCLAPRVTDAESPELLGIDLHVLRPLCADGIPEEVPALRAALWKLLLGYLPVDVFRWDSTLASARAAYPGLVGELLERLEGEAQASGPSLEDGEAVEERPLGQLQEILEQIGKDTYRTRSEMEFFMHRIDGSDDGLDISSKSSDAEEEPPDIATPSRHYDVVARILLLYARLNPGVRYVQGMNELLAPLYYLFAQDPLNRKCAEADAFFCFSLLMGSMRDAFVKDLDYTDQGMIGQTHLFCDLLREKDEELWQHLESCGVEPVFYAVRWLTLMLAQDLEMPEVLCLWDALLGDLAQPRQPRQRPRPLLHYVCVSIVVRLREALLAGDFAVCLGLLQHGPAFAVEEVLQAAARFRSADLVPTGFSNRDVRALLRR